MTSSTSYRADNGHSLAGSSRDPRRASTLASKPPSVALTYALLVQAGGGLCPPPSAAPPNCPGAPGVWASPTAAPSPQIRGTLKSWTKLWCVLKPGVLLIYKTPKVGQWVGTVLLHCCELIERPSKKDGFCFKLFHPLDQSVWAVKVRGGGAGVGPGGTPHGRQALGGGQEGNLRVPNGPITSQRLGALGGLSGWLGIRCGPWPSRGSAQWG